MGGSLSSLSGDTHLLLVLPLLFVLNNSIDLGKQGEIFSHAHVFTGKDTGSFLTNQNISCLNALAAVLLHAEALPSTVPTIPRATPCFLVRHSVPPKTLNSRWGQSPLSLRLPIISSFHKPILQLLSLLLRNGNVIHL